MHYALHVLDASVCGHCLASATLFWLEKAVPLRKTVYEHRVAVIMLSQNTLVLTAML